MKIWNNVLTWLALLISLFAGSASAVQAAASNLEVPVDPGQLELNVPGTLRFFPINMASLYPSAGAPRVTYLTLGLDFTISVNDYTGKHAGWQLQAAMTGLSASNAPVASDVTGDLYFSNPDITSELPETRATSPKLTKIPTGDARQEFGPQVTLFSAPPDTGVGKNAAIFGLPDVRLALNFNVYAVPRRYSGTIKWTLSQPLPTTEN